MTRVTGVCSKSIKLIRALSTVHTSPWWSRSSYLQREEVTLITKDKRWRNHCSRTVKHDLQLLGPPPCDGRLFIRPGACWEGLEVEVETRADRKGKKGKITACNMLRPHSYSFIPLLPFKDGVTANFPHKWTQEASVTLNAAIFGDPFLSESWLKYVCFLTQTGFWQAWSYFNELNKHSLRVIFLFPLRTWGDSSSRAFNMTRHEN